MTHEYDRRTDRRTSYSLANAVLNYDAQSKLET